MTEDLEFPEKKIHSPVLTFSRQLPRAYDTTKLKNRLVLREDKRMMETLPAHMHNVNNRMACSNTLERTLRESKYQHADWLNIQPKFGFKKTFRKDGSPPPVFDP